MPTRMIWLICIYIPAITGPMGSPTILKMTVIPREIPSNFFGVDSKIIFMVPTCIRDIPVATIPRFVDTKNAVE